MIKKLIWLIKHQEEIAKLLMKKETPKETGKDEDFSTDGVPDFQKAYVEDLLNGNIKKK